MKFRISSLSYVARLPLDKVKIDRSFISGMAGGEQEVSIVSTIINLSIKNNKIYVYLSVTS